MACNRKKSIGWIDEWLVYRKKSIGWIDEWLVRSLGSFREVRNQKLEIMVKMMDG